MGLLDDAIREHLELKRRHGADPEEVARQERAALAPPDAEEPRVAEPLPDGEEPGLDEDEDADALDVEESSRPDPSAAIQETAEIDMRTVLEGIDAEDEEVREMSAGAARSPHETPAAARVEPPSSTPGIESDSLEWDAPATRGRLFKRRHARARASEG
jgi:hypothetical protein